MRILVSGGTLFRDGRMERADLAVEDGRIVSADAAVAAFRSGEHATVVVTADTVLSIYDRQGRKIMDGKEQFRIDFIDLAGNYLLTASRDTPSLRLREWNPHTEARLFRYDPDYIHDHVSVHDDRTTAMLYWNRGFQITNPEGEVLYSEELPDTMHVYSMQYRRNPQGDYLEVFYDDGRVRRYDAKNGEFLGEMLQEPPDGTHDEGFEMEDASIDAPLIGTPEIYQSDGTYIGELDPDGYMVNAVQTGDFLVTEYINANGERYGFLLTLDGKAIADLPNICDILSDGTLIFDDQHGNLYYSRIYSLEELLVMANSST